MTQLGWFAYCDRCGRRRSDTLLDKIGSHWFCTDADDCRRYCGECPAAKKVMVYRVCSLLQRQRGHGSHFLSKSLGAAVRQALSIAKRRGQRMYVVIEHAETSEPVK